jgi:hypothetical protein
MLEVIGAGNPDYKGQDWGDVWENSPESKKLSDDLENIINSRRSRQQDEVTKDDREFAMPLYAQIVAVTKRAFVAYWRLPNYILVSCCYSEITKPYSLQNYAGKNDASHLYGLVQHLYILAFGEQLY